MLYIKTVLARLQENKSLEISGKLLVRNTVLNLIGQVAPLVVGMISIPLVIRSLGTERFGLLSLVWMFLGYFTSFDLGLGRAVTKGVGEALGRDDRDAAARLAWTAVLFQGGAGLVAAAIMIGVTPLLVGRLLKISPGLLEEAKLTFRTLALAVPVVWVSGSFSGVLQAAQRFDLENTVKVPLGISTLLLPLFGVALGLGLSEVGALLVAARGAALLAYARFCFRLFPQLGANLSADGDSLRSLLTFGGWISVSAALESILNYLERGLLASLLSVAALAFYTAPYEMIARVVVVPASMSTTLFPAFSYRGGSACLELRDMLTRPAKYLLLIMTPLSLMCIVLARPVLTIWLGPDFAQVSARLFQILVVTFFLHSFAYVPLAAVQALGRPDLKAKLDLVAVPVFLALCWSLIPRLGLVGAGLAKLSITVLDVLCLSGMVMSVSGLRLGDLLSGRLGEALGVSAAFALVVLALGLGSEPSGLNALVLICLVGAYVLAFFEFCVDEKDWAAFHGIRGLVFRK